MKTILEDLQDRIENLRRAENSCIERGKLSAAFVWKRHRMAIEKIRDAMDVSDAGKPVDVSERISGVMVRDGVMVAV